MAVSPERKHSLFVSALSLQVAHDTAVLSRESFSCQAMSNSPLLAWEALLHLSLIDFWTLSDGARSSRCKGSGWDRPGAGLSVVCSFRRLSVCSAAVPGNNGFIGC